MALLLGFCFFEFFFLLKISILGEVKSSYTIIKPGALKGKYRCNPTVAYASTGVSYLRWAIPLCPEILGLFVFDIDEQFVVIFRDIVVYAGSF